MAKTKKDKKLYAKMREHGIRKSVAKDLSELPAHASDGKQAPKPLRDAVDRLEGLVEELKSHTQRGERKTAARKAARTRSQDAASRSASARKAARTRAKSSTTAKRTTSSAAKRTSAASTKRTGAAASKPRAPAKSRTAAKPRARRSTAKTSAAS